MMQERERRNRVRGARLAVRLARKPRKFDNHCSCATKLRRASADTIRVVFLKRSLPRVWQNAHLLRFLPQAVFRCWGVVQPVAHLTVNEAAEGSNTSAPAKFLRKSRWNEVARP